MLQLVANDGLVLGTGSQGDEARQSNGESSLNGKSANTDDNGRDKAYPNPWKEPARREKR
jgi:hypothetical protein